MKKVLIAIPILIIVIIVALSFSLNSIIKKGVETVGPNALGADVRLKDVSMSLLSGKGALKGLFIGNPQGFKSDSAFQLGEVRLALDVQSVFSDKIIIDEVYIDGPDITYEKGIKGDNIRALLKNIESFSGAAQKTGQDKESKEAAASETKVQISNFIVKNGKINMSMSALQGEKLSFALPDIHLKDIGKEKDGTTISKALKEVFAVVNKNIITASAGSLKDIGGTVEKTVKGTVGESVDKLKGLLGK
ncbi:MAG: AsmA family protein [Nitrospiraceae bacterium]|nr:MAG: AsmA family protein [Nitrospiraceae bacterium]